MGFFSDIFGSSSDKYSSELHLWSIQELRLLFENHVHIPSLTPDEKHLVEQTLEVELRQHDDRISLRQINDLLRKLKYNSGLHISENSRLALMKMFSEYFNTHFGQRHF